MNSCSPPPPQFSLDSNRVAQYAIRSTLLAAVLLTLIWAGTTTAHAQGERPAKPTGLRVTTVPGSLEVSVEWNDVAGAADYRVRWRVAGPGNRLNDGVRASSSDTRITVANYGDWVVRVEACNDSGCGPGQAKRFQVEPVPELTSTATPEPTPTPIPEPAATPTPESISVKPTGLQVTVTTGSLEVAVEWNDVAGAADYRVRWRVAGPGNRLNDGVRASSSDTRITVADYGDWVVRVEACNDSGCGPGQAKRFQVESVPEPTPTPTPTPVPFNVRLNGTPCRFIDAVTAANTDTVTGDCPAGSGADTITLIMNVILEAHVPDITSEISIEGGGFSISGSDGDSLFKIKRNAIVSISDVTLTELETDKVIFNYGSLTISDSTLEDNDVSNVIDNLGDGVLAISNSLFQNNAADGGGVIEISGGGPITITNSRFVDNEDRAIYNQDGPLTISNSVFSGNSGGGDGGALRNSARDHTVNIRQSAFIENSSGGTGGAISHDRGTMIIRNSTFSGNTSKVHGGGLYARGGDITMTHVTFANNSDHGVFINEGGTINLRNSIIADSQEGDCDGTLAENISNYIEDGSCSAVLDSDDGAINLGILTGAPAYHPLLDGSRAINSADADHCLDTDQTGQARPYPAAGECDIGAFEYRSS